MPSVVDWSVRLSTAYAKRKIGQTQANRILIDNSTLGHAVTHETCWVNTEEKLWGGETPISTGYSARIPVYHEKDSSAIFQNIKYLAPIASLARQGSITLFTSPELRDEQMTQPTGRFSGYGRYDFNLFSGVQFEHLIDLDFIRIISPMRPCIPSIEEQRKNRLDKKLYPLYRQLTEVLGPKNSQDAYHIYTAEVNNCYCFLTMDLKLIRSIKSQKGHPAIASLRTKVLSPKEYGNIFSLYPISPRLFSFHNASYPVLYNANWPDSKRKKPRPRN